MTTSLPLRTEAACPTCHGSGAKPGTHPHTCAVCGGCGQTVRQQGGFGFAEPCRACHGRGQVVDDPCPTCSGVGATMQTRTVNVASPPASKTGDAARPRQRSPRTHGGPAGDLLVTVHVTQAPRLWTQGRQPDAERPVTFAEAALGATIAVPTLDGEPVSLKIPAGTPSGRTFRVKGRGLTTKSKYRRPAGHCRGCSAATRRRQGQGRPAAIREATADDDPRADLLAQAEKE